MLERDRFEYYKDFRSSRRNKGPFYSQISPFRWLISVANNWGERREHGKEGTITSYSAHTGREWGEKKWGIEGCQRADKKFPDGNALMSRYDPAYRLLLVTPKRETLWKLKRARRPIDTGWKKGLGATRAGESGLMFRCTVARWKKMWRGSDSCPILPNILPFLMFIEHQTTFSTTFQWTN